MRYAQSLISAERPGRRSFWARLPICLMNHHVSVYLAAVGMFRVAGSALWEALI